MSAHEPTQKTARTRHLTVAALLAAMTAGTSWISVPFGPVPVTFQTMFVLLAGLLLPPGWAAASMGLYLVLGAIGLPVFAGGQGGLSVLLGPTGGFLAAFPIAAAVVSIVHRVIGSRRGFGPRGTLSGVAAVVAGEAVIYAVGVPWLMAQTGMTVPVALSVAVVPFVVPDAVKATVAVVLAGAIRRAVER